MCKVCLAIFPHYAGKDEPILGFYYHTETSHLIFSKLASSSNATILKIDSTITFSENLPKFWLGTFFLTADKQ